MSTSADEPRVRIIPIVDDAYSSYTPMPGPENEPGELRPGGQTVKPAATRPWFSVGERFVDGIPYPQPKFTDSSLLPSCRP